MKVAKILDLDLKDESINDKFINLKYVYEENGFIKFKIILNITEVKLLFKVIGNQ